MTLSSKTQYAQGEGKEPQHSHPSATTHDHYHVSHHHGGKVIGEWGLQDLLAYPRSQSQ